MKKFTILLALIACASLIFAQSVKNEIQQTERKAERNYSGPTNFPNAKAVKPLNNTKSEDAWVQDFEGGATWTIENESPSGTARSTIIWEVGNHTQFSASYIGRWFGTTPTDYFFKGGKAAYIDVIKELTDPSIGRSKGINTFIKFDADLTNLTKTPKLSFYQQIRTLNKEEQWLEWIIGTNWQTAELNEEINFIRLNETLEGNTDGDTLCEVLLPGAEGNTISFRLRWKQTYGATTEHAYFWLVDNIVIDNAPDYDLILNDYRVNFFEFIDYHTTPSVNPDDERKINYAFHYSSHVGEFPKSFAQNGNAMIGFSASTLNLGDQDATADIKVSVVHASTGTEVYTYTMQGANINESNTLGDTLDVWGNNAWTVPADVATGEYHVNFEVIARGHTDEIPDNNKGQALFHITDDQYSRCPGTINAVLSPNNWTLVSDGTAGSAFGFPHFFMEDKYISSLSFFIGRQTTGGSIEIEALYSTPSITDAIVTSTTYTVKSTDIGKFITVPFEKVINAETELDPETNQKYCEARFNFHFNYGNNDTLDIGFDKSQKCGYYGSLLLFGERWSVMNDGNPGVILNMFDEVSRQPAVGATEVPTNAEISMQFTDSIPLRNLNTVRIEKVIDGTLVSGVAAVRGSDPTKFTISHDELAKGREYKVVIPENVINGHNEISWTFKTEGTASIGDNLIANLEIYPNPTNGMLNINNVKGGTIEVLNIMGQVIEKIDVANETNTINISNYSNGNYFVRVNLNGEIRVEKVNLAK